MGWLHRNSNRACAKASLMSFEVVWYFCLNSLGDSIWRVSGFWIWWRVVMLYVCSLLIYSFEACFCSRDRWVYPVVRVHASSIADCFMGKCFIVVCTCISYSLSSRYSVRVVGDLPHA